MARKLRRWNGDVEIDIPDGVEVHEYLREHPEIMEEILEKENLARRHEYYITMVERELQKSLSREIFLIQALRAVDDLNQIINLMGERIREWYGYYDPDVVNQEQEDLIAGVAEGGSGSDMAPPGVSEEDLDVIRYYATKAMELMATRKRLLAYIESTSREIMSNLSGLIGPVLAARLVAEAGSLQKLAEMPASTIQVLGAEKALFRHIRSGAKPPKYGHIFQHPYIHRAPQWQRGAIARAMAGKIAIAARMDWVRAEDRSDELRKDLERRIEEIRKKKQRPKKKRRVKSYTSRG